MIAAVPAFSELRADVVATYSGIFARPLRESGASGWIDVQTAFLAWLDNCGWFVENYAGVTYMTVPAAAAVEGTPR